jgi:tight adherence protein C
MPEILIAILIFVAVVCLGGAYILARRGGQRVIQERLRKAEVQPEARSEPFKPGLTRFLTYIGVRASSGKTSPGLQEELARAGFHGQNATAAYLGTKVLMLVVGLVVMAVLVMPTSLRTPSKMLLVAVGAVGLSFVPNLVVYSRCRKRTEEIRHHLPDALDLLEICVSAGMGLDMAWNAVTDEIREVSPTLADEMALTNLEIHLGAPRAEAMRHMADRTGGQDLSSLVAILVQSERFGTSIADGLQTFASSLREIRSQRAQEAAEKMAVKLILPMTLCFFPAVLVVLIGPAGIKLMEKLVGS